MQRFAAEMLPAVLERAGGSMPSGVDRRVRQLRSTRCKPDERAAARVEAAALSFRHSSALRQSPGAERDTLNELVPRLLEQRSTGPDGTMAISRSWYRSAKRRLRRRDVSPAQPRQETPKVKAAQDLRVELRPLLPVDAYERSVVGERSSRSKTARA